MSLFYILTSVVRGKYASQLKWHLLHVATTLINLTKGKFTPPEQSQIPLRAVRAVIQRSHNQKRGQQVETLN